MLRAPAECPVSPTKREGATEIGLDRRCRLSDHPASVDDGAIDDGKQTFADSVLLQALRDRQAKGSTAQRVVEISSTTLLSNGRQPDDRVSEFSLVPVLCTKPTTTLRPSLLMLFYQAHHRRWTWDPPRVPPHQPITA